VNQISHEERREERGERGEAKLRTAFPEKDPSPACWQVNQISQATNK
jgi:hypothetical protein